MMKRKAHSSSLAILAIAAVLVADLALMGLPLLGPAPSDARVGRPATPISVAGVARRTTRRTVVATTAVATTAVVATAPAQTCVTSYDTYGRKVTTCY